MRDAKFRHSVTMATYDQDGNRADLGANRYVQIRDNWYYVGNDGILTGEHIIDGAYVYFEYGGKQVKGDFGL